MIKRVNDLWGHPTGDRLLAAGVAVLAAGETDEELLARADRALYDAKGSGRNRVALSVPPPGPPGAPEECHDD